MKNFNQKQKVAMIIILIFIISAFCYYIYSRENVEVISTDEDTIIEETKEENKETVTIHIAGAVQNEGMIQLEKGKRISDAVEMAGGLKQNADLTNINLAYVLEDGEKIYIPTINEIEVVTNRDPIDVTKQTNKKVNINTATQAELETLPGIGESTAQKIIEYRKENGRFTKIEDLKNVSGIGEKKYEKIKEQITT